MSMVHDLPNGVRLRATTPADREFERRLHDAGREDLLMIDGEEDFIKSIFDLQMHARDAGYGATFPNAQYYIIEKNAENIGRLVIDFGHNEVRIVDISLHPLWHGKNIGSTVLQAMMHVAGQIGAPVVLTVARHNTQAAALYARMGFVEDPDASRMQSHALMRWEPGKDQMRTSVFMPGGAATQ